jgi:hypothetical protein
MPMTIDVDHVTGRLIRALNTVAGGEAPPMSMLGAARLRAVAQYAGLVGDAYAAGALEDDEMTAELDALDRMTGRATRDLDDRADATPDSARETALGILLDAVRTGLSLAGAPLPREIGRPATDSPAVSAVEGGA